MSDEPPDEDLGDNYFLMFDDKEGLDEAESIIAAVECLSPAVRELLVSNPDGFERAVKRQHLLAVGELTSGEHYPGEVTEAKGPSP